MDDWIEEDLSLLAEDEQEKGGRVLDQRMIREPIRMLNPPLPITLPRTATVGEAIALMQSHRIGCILIVEGEQLVGIVSERDVLLKVVGTDTDLQRARVEQVMTPDPEVLRPEDGIVFALNKMSVGGFRHVPLVDDAKRPVGVVSVKNIVEYIVDFFPKEVLNLPPEPDKNVARAREGA
jgi:CBS domain-containing protein